MQNCFYDYRDLVCSRGKDSELYKGLKKVEKNFCDFYVENDANGSLKIIKTNPLSGYITCKNKNIVWKYWISPDLIRLSNENEKYDISYKKPKKKEKEKRKSPTLEELNRFFKNLSLKEKIKRLSL